jgi:hypothetical protein
MEGLRIELRSKARRRVGTESDRIQSDKVFFSGFSLGFS